jgi:hypothetical protein
MRLQYLETLKDVGTAPSTKIVVPMELGGLIGGLQALLPGAPSNNSTTAGDGSNTPESNGGVDRLP